MRKLSRREFIAGTSATVLVGSLTGLYLTNKADVIRKKSQTDNQIASSEVNEVIDNISDIGRLYLEKKNLSSDSSTRKQLLNLLGFESMESYQSLLSSFNVEINEKIKVDIKKRKWCIVDGWQLTETECMISAIAYIETGVEKGIIDKGKYKNIPFDMLTGNIAKITAWGPKKTSQGQSFNSQPNGNSALWVKVTGLAGPHYVVYFGKYPTHSTVHASGLITADLLPVEALEATSETGIIPIYLVDTRKFLKQEIGSFTITEGQGEKISKQYLQCYEQVKIGDLAKIIAWGPETTKMGKAFNIQPDKSSAFWIKINKVNKGEYTVALGDVVLKTNNYDKGGYELLTASVEDYVTAAIIHKAQQIPLYIIFDNKKQNIGFFNVK